MTPRARMKINAGITASGVAYCGVLVAAPADVAGPAGGVYTALILGLFIVDWGRR